MRGIAGAVVSIVMSLGAIFGAAHAGRWGQLAFAGCATAAIVAGAWVYAVIWARRERRRLAGRL